MDSVYGSLSDIPEPFRSFNFVTAQEKTPDIEISDDMFLMLMMMILI